MAVGWIVWLVTRYGINWTEAGGQGLRPEVTTAAVTSGQFLLKSKEEKNVPGIILMEKIWSIWTARTQRDLGQQVKFCSLSLWSSVICDEISFFSYFSLKSSGYTDPESIHPSVHTYMHTHTWLFGMIHLFCIWNCLIIVELKRDKVNIQILII